MKRVGLGGSKPQTGDPARGHVDIFYILHLEDSFIKWHNETESRQERRWNRLSPTKSPVYDTRRLEVRGGRNTCPAVVYVVEIVKKSERQTHRVVYVDHS